MIFRIVTFSFLLILFANAGQCAYFMMNTSEINSVNVRVGALPTTIPAEPYIPTKNPDESSMCIFKPEDITSVVKQAIEDHRENPTAAFEMALNFPLDTETLIKVRGLFRDASYEDKLTSLHLLQLTSPTLPDDIFVGFSNLRHLTIGYLLMPTNVLTSLSPRTFSGLRALEVLSIHDRNLREISAGAFDDLVSLRELTLTTCISLDHMPLASGLLPSLEYLDIGMMPHAFRFCSFGKLPSHNKLLSLAIEQFGSSRHDNLCWHLWLSKPAAGGEESVYNRFVRQLELLSDITGADAASAAGTAADTDDASSVTSSGSGPQALHILTDGRDTTGPVRQQVG